jgi:hypothetical protein
MANPPDARQPAMPQVGDQSLAATGDQRLLQALTTEHFTLQTARSATIMETNGRSALFLSTVSSAVVALAFIGQVADVGQPFFLFALAVLPTLFLLGLLTYLRLTQSATDSGPAVLAGHQPHPPLLPGTGPGRAILVPARGSR